MKDLIKALAFVVCVVCLLLCTQMLTGQIVPGALHRLVGNPVASGGPSWTDPTGSNALNRWWVAEDSAIGAVNTSTDRISGCLLIDNSTIGYSITNSTNGFFFYGANSASANGTRMTNEASSFGSNFTTSFIFKPTSTNASYNCLFEFDYTSGGANGTIWYYGENLYLQVAAPTLLASLPALNWYVVSLIFSNNQYLCFTNGVLSASGVAFNNAEQNLLMVGRDTDADNVWNGWLRELLICTNIFSGLNVSNYHYYATNKYGFSP